MFPISHPHCLSIALFAAISLLGCGTPADNAVSGKLPDEPPPIAHDHGDHPSKGPHDGDLIDFGGEYHAEMLHDTAAGKITIYILDAAAQQEVSIADDAIVLNALIGGEPTQFKPAPVSGADGRASQFEVVSKQLLAALEHANEAKTRLNVTIDGKPFYGNLGHHAHGDHGH